MNDELVNLAKRIRDEIVQIERSLKKIIQGWHIYKTSHDDFYLDSVALNLHSFYSGLERIFEFIAEVIDGTKPTGEYWHQELLNQVSTEKPSVRPALISKDSYNRLHEFRKFRHYVRFAYTFTLDSSKMSTLIEQAPKLFDQIKSELLAFANFLEQVENR
jgi:hypothetical protein